MVIKVLVFPDQVEGVIQSKITFFLPDEYLYSIEVCSENKESVLS